MADLLLLLETSGKQCSVAVAQVEGSTQQVLAEAEYTVPMKHTSMILPLIKKAFAKTDYRLQDTSAVAVSSGPGSYTALRAGFSSAKGLCMALNIPLITVSTLKALASRAQEVEAWEGEIVSILPARRRDVFFSKFNGKLGTLIQPVCEEVDENWWRVLFEGSRTLLAGPFAKEFCLEYGQQPPYIDVALSASNLLKVSALKFTEKDFSDISSVEPNYLKPPFITKSKPRLPS